MNNALFLLAIILAGLALIPGLGIPISVGGAFVGTGLYALIIWIMQLIGANGLSSQEQACLSCVMACLGGLMRKLGNVWTPNGIGGIGGSLLPGWWGFIWGVIWGGIGWKGDTDPWGDYHGPRPLGGLL